MHRQRLPVALLLLLVAGLSAASPLAAVTAARCLEHKAVDCCDADCQMCGCCLHPMPVTGAVRVATAAALPGSPAPESVASALSDPSPRSVLHVPRRLLAV